MSDSNKQEEFCEGPQGCELSEWDPNSEKCKRCVDEHNSYYSEVIASSRM